MSTNLTADNDRERAREAAEARAALERRAAELGVGPFDVDAWRSEFEPEPDPEEARREVDDFLKVVRELRDTPPAGGLG